MSNPAPVVKSLDREFLAIRCKLIDLAAALDRVDRSGDTPADDPRLIHIRRSLDVLGAASPDRAERIQMEFSLPYEERD